MTATEVPEAAPEWFDRAIGAPKASRSVEVEGCPIHYLAWGDPERPGLLFVPASGGHAHWFAHVAPFFTDQFHVAALDLSGCGDSGRRETYTRELVTAEIGGVLAHSGMFDAEAPPTVAGHSAGAQCAVRAGIALGEQLLGVVAIDGLRYAELEKDQAIKILSGPREAPRPPRVHASFEEAVARFRLTPKPLMGVGHGYIVENIARNSFRPVEGGWTSKYDTSQSAVTTLAFELTGALKDLKCRAAAIYADHSHLADETAAQEVTRMNDGRVTAMIIPGTSHYPQIDSPFAFVAAIKAIALTWLAERMRNAAPHVSA